MKMSFGQMVDVLKEKHKGKIVLIKLGAFYVALEEDAVLLHEKLGLNCTCFKNNSCKVGLPINSIGKYLKEIDKLKYGYVVYDYDKEKQELIKVSQKVGKINKERRKNANCLYCKGGSKYNLKDPYLQAVIKLLIKEHNLELDPTKLE